MYKKQAFTLIELLVVVAIIGVLSSIIVPNLSTSKDDAQDARGIKTVQNIVLAFNVEQDDDNIFPAYNDLTSIDAAIAASGPRISITDPESASSSFCVSYTLVNPEEDKEIYKATPELSDLVPLAAGAC